MSMEIIQRVELASDAGAIAFTSIPQTGYSDLFVVFSVRSSRPSQIFDYVQVRFNDSTSGYNNRHISGDGSNIGSGAFSGESFLRLGITTAANSTAGVFSSGQFYIPNYRANTNKVILNDQVSEGNIVNTYQWLSAGAWSNTAAINKIDIRFYETSSNLLAGSSATLYGIKDATGANLIKATGGTINVSGGYVYHTFRTSGTFAPTSTITNAETLVIAGGGGAGGENGGGGGGAGGLRYASGLTISTSQVVTVGAGGTGNVPANNGPANGNNSSLGSLLVSTGGGRASDPGWGLGAGSGGSGGGGTYGSTTPGSGIAGQGFAGGSGGESGGGGGGAGGVGGNSGNQYFGGAAGAGTSSYSVWAFATQTGEQGFYASGGVGGNRTGGGSVGARALGGGGGQAQAGLANTGGGGGAKGAAGSADAQKPGGSGLVIIRYPAEKA